MIQAAIDRMLNGANDEIYTPEEAVLPILPYLNKNLTYWECTDYGDSRITKVLREHGFKVVANKIDFLKDKPDFEYDAIITNPPYSIKDDFIERAIELRKPTIFLLPITALEGRRRHDLYNKLGSFGLCVFDKRINFLNQKKSNYFNTSWFFLNCWWNQGIKFIKLGGE